MPSVIFSSWGCSVSHFHCMNTAKSSLEPSPPSTLVPMPSLGSKHISLNFSFSRPETSQNYPNMPYQIGKYESNKFLRQKLNMHQHQLALSIDPLDIVVSFQHPFSLFLVMIPILTSISTHPNIGGCFREKDYILSLGSWMYGLADSIISAAGHLSCSGIATGTCAGE